MKIIVEVLDKVVAKDDKGKVIKDESTYLLIGKARCDFIYPFGTENTKQIYGADIQTSHRTFTYDEIPINKYIRYENKIYYVRSVEKYRNRSVVLLEMR